MKEMVGGCCVCSDERGFFENPLVYCDGQGCNVAVHQACYGIVQVPTGPWFCRKCESQERSAKVRCELCPSRDGALKKTDNSGWAHVVCALYIPEVRFGNNNTMEPIVLQLVPPERYNKTCSLCEENGKEGRAKIGACMACNKQGCRQYFHVTCAQAAGLLCEEAGNNMDNVKYCGYCRHHYHKLVTNSASAVDKKENGSSIKPIPAFRPIPSESMTTSESSPEKTSPTSVRQSIMGIANTNAHTVANLNVNSNASPLSMPPTSENVLNSTIGGKNMVRKKCGKATSSTNSSAMASPSSIHSNSNHGSQVSASHQQTFSSVVKCIAADKLYKPEETSPTPSPSHTHHNHKQGLSPPPNELNHQDSKLSSHSLNERKKKKSIIKEIGSSSSSPQTTRPESGSNHSNSFLPVMNSLDVKPPQINPVPSFTAFYGNYLANTSSSGSYKPKFTSADRKSHQNNIESKSLTNKAQTNVTQTTSLKRNKSSDGNVKKKEKVKKTIDNNDDYENENEIVPVKLMKTKSAAKDFSTTTDKAMSVKRQRKKKSGNIELNGTKNGKGMRLDHTYYRSIPVNQPNMTPLQNGYPSTTPSFYNNQLNPTSFNSFNGNLTQNNMFFNPATQEQGVSPADANTKCPSKNFPSKPSDSADYPQTLEQLLERQWAQGSSFIIDQAQHFDIASLLSCLHQLRSENNRLEERVRDLMTRRDHLLAVNARLSQPSSNVYPINGALSAHSFNSQSNSNSSTHPSVHNNVNASHSTSPSVTSPHMQTSSPSIINDFNKCVRSSSPGQTPSRPTHSQTPINTSNTSNTLAFPTDLMVNNGSQHRELYSAMQSNMTNASSFNSILNTASPNNTSTSYSPYVSHSQSQQQQGNSSASTTASCYRKSGASSSSSSSSSNKR